MTGYPTTAGDFCRRFEASDVEILMNIINDVRVKVWQQQPVTVHGVAGGVPSPVGTARE